MTVTRETLSATLKTTFVPCIFHPSPSHNLLLPHTKSPKFIFVGYINFNSCFFPPSFPPSHLPSFLPSLPPSLPPSLLPSFRARQALYYWITFPAPVFCCCCCSTGVELRTSHFRGKRENLKLPYKLNCWSLFLIFILFFLQDSMNNVFLTFWC
jgi:hypothetical protein